MTEYERGAYDAIGMAIIRVEKRAEELSTKQKSFKARVYRELAVVLRNVQRDLERPRG